MNGSNESGPDRIRVVFGALRLEVPRLVPLFQLMLAYANVLAL
jgi:hypothetical protein